MSELAETLRAYLLQFARAGTPINYGKFASDNGFNWFDDKHVLSAALAEIVEYDHAHGLPLLSSLVIKLDGDIGSGFWYKVHQVGIPVVDKLKFLVNEWNRVHAHYRAE